MRSAPLLTSLSILVFAASTGCGPDAPKGAAANKPAVDKPATDKPATDKPAGAVTEKPADGKVEEIHFDITLDKSGVLARAASVLETSEALSTPTMRAHIAELSHHAEKTPSNEALCKHMIGLMAEKAPDPVECAHALEHQRIHLGPEVFGLVAKCVTDAKTMEVLMRCEDAEKEAERLIHERKTALPMSLEACEKLFVQFEKLAMADAGDQAKVVEEILEEVRADTILACREHGTQAELDCAMAAKDLETIGKCTSSIL